MGVELRQLRFLDAVADAGSISGAARRLYMTQPAVTVALRNLERDVGVTLLTRHTTGVDLTVAGSAFLTQARHALEHIDEATCNARQLGAPLHGATLTVGFLPATFSAVPRTIINAFRTQYPQVRVAFRELSYIGHTRDLLTGKVDVAFLWPPYDEPMLLFHPLSHEPRVLGVADSHPLADRHSVALDDILDLPFPGFHPASSGGWFASWFFNDYRGAPATTTRDETSTAFEMALVVQEGRAIAPATQSFANAFPADRVRWLAITDAPPATLALAWNRSNPSAPTHAVVRLARALSEIAPLTSTTR